MNRAKIAGAVLALMMIPFLVMGCKKDVKVEVKKDEIKELLCAIRSYECDVKVIFCTDNQRNEIHMKQVCDIEGNHTLTIEWPERLKGYQTIFNKEGVKEYNPITGKTVPLKASAAKNQLLFGTFVENYLKSEKTSAYKEKINGVPTTVIETTIPGNYKYMVMQRVWFDEKKRAPVKMQIYDKEGKVTIEVNFSNFNYNKEMKWDL